MYRYNSGFHPFSCTDTVKRLGEFEEIEISSNAVEVNTGNKEDNSSFVWNSASGNARNL